MSENELRITNAEHSGSSGVLHSGGKVVGASSGSKGSGEMGISE